MPGITLPAPAAPAAPPAPAIAPFPGGGPSPAAAVKSGGKAPAPLDVTGAQKLLAQHGYQIPVDGINGPLTQAAMADFRGSRNPAAFNVGHGLAHGAGPTVVPGVTTLPARAGQTVPMQTEPAKPGQSAPVKPLAAGRGAPKPGIPDLSPTQNNSPAAKPAAAAATPSSAAAPAGSSDAAVASSTINAIIAPLIKQIQDAEAQRSTQGQQLISGYTQDALNQLKGIDFQAPYTGAAGSENAVNTALLNELQGQGAGLQNELGATLAKAGADPAFAASLAARVGADTSGAAGANLARGDATASAFLSQGADAKSYGQKLGPITSLAGAQDVSKLLGQVANDQKTQLDSIQSKVPGMVQSELATLSSARTAAEKNRIASIIAEGYDPTTGQLTPKARSELAAATGTDPVTGQPTAKTTIAETNAATAKARAANAASPKASAAVSKQLGYLADTNGNPILRNGKQVPVTKAGTALSPNETATLTAKAEKDAEDLYHGVTKTVGGKTVTVSYSVPYQDAIKTLVNRYPFLGLPGAIKLANSLYPAGGTFPGGVSNGRPAPTNSAKTNQAAASGLGVPVLTGPLAGLRGGK